MRTCEGRDECKYLGCIPQVAEMAQVCNKWNSDHGFYATMSVNFGEYLALYNNNISSFM